MNWRDVTLGLCPIGKFVFSHEDACRYKQMLQDRLTQWGVRYVDIEGVVPDGMVRDQAHVEPVVEHLRKHEIDGLFLPHCNFGTEGAAGVIARDLGVPTLLWGPRDEAPLADGTRLRDSLCGLFATSKVLHKLGVTFTHIENCRVDDPPLKEGLIDFLRVTAVVKAFRGMRIGLMGGRIDFFWTTKINESELLERFGIEVEPMDLVAAVKAVKQKAQANAATYAEELEQLRDRFVFEGFADDQPLINNLALRDFLLEWAAQRRLSVVCVETFPSLTDELGAYDGLATALACDKGLPIICESDVHGAISAVMLQAAAAEPASAFFADLTVRHPEDDNGILLWHCHAPESMAAEGVQRRIAPHWILPSPLSGICHWRLKDGPVTVARFDGDRGEYRLISGAGRTMEGPSTQNVYLWMKVDDWPRWEKAFIHGPYIHHMAAVHDQADRILLESCRYIPGLAADTRLQPA